jgi:hypothetical protein
VKNAVLAIAGLCVVVPGRAALAGDGEKCGACPVAAAEAREEWSGKSAAAKSASDRYALGMWCREKGLLPEASAEFREAVRLDPAHSASREALGEQKVDGRWVSPEAAMESKGLVRHDGRWVLPEEKARLEMPAAEKERTRREEDRARSLLRTMAAGDARAAGLAREAFASVEDRCKTTPLAYALRSTEKPVRLFAASELGRIRDRRTLKPLVHRAVRDPDPEVRAACVDAARAFGDAELLAPFVGSLLHAADPAHRAAAAEAVGRSGDMRGVYYLVYELEAHGGGPRSNIYVANQLTFVQDFDVEVAQTAFIADPQVGLLQDGAVLDAQVVGSSVHQTRVEKHVVAGALRRLTGADMGESAAAWRKWMQDNREKLVAAR